MADRKTFIDSVVPLPHDGPHQPMGMVVQSTPAVTVSEPFKLHFTFAAPPGAQTDLEKLVASGQVASPEDLAKSLPSETDVSKLKQWLETQGYTDIEQKPDGVYAAAPASTVAKSLDVQLVQVTRDGFTHTAARNAPSLPADVATNVQAIDGLQPFLRANRHSRKRTPKDANRISLGNTPHGMVRQSTQQANVPPFLVPEIMKAYGADDLDLTGEGQTIGILIDTFPLDDDLTAFWAANNIPVDLSRIEKINVDGGPLPAPEGEETLDVSWTSGIAQKAKIRVYACGGLSFVALDRALDRIIADADADPSMRQVSISLGLGEAYLGGANGEVATQHGKFLQLAARGVNVFVSTGDAGSNPDQSGHSSGGPTQAEYASSDPAVVAVGGTTLVLDGDGSVKSEVGWANGGGGMSKFFGRPAWQEGTSVPIESKRTVPDVSAVADPDTGAFLILAGKTMQFGGTSWSAPIWAGFCALINEARVKAGAKPLAFMNPSIYPLIGTPSFRDITQGNNGQWDAKVGYDLVTGIGVPNVKQLVAALTGGAVVASAAIEVPDTPRSKVRSSRAKHPLKTEIA